MSDQIMLVTKEELMALPVYPASTGGPLEEVPVGTLWRRNDRAGDPWLIGEWTGKVGQDVRIIWREARVCSIQERIRTIREEKLGEFSKAFDVERKAMQEMIRELQGKNIALAENLNKLNREREELVAFRSQVYDWAFLQMTQPQQFGQGAPFMKAFEDRLKALEEAKDKTADKNLRLNFCNLFNKVDHWLEMLEERGNPAPQDIKDVLEECRSYMGA